MDSLLVLRRENLNSRLVHIARRSKLGDSYLDSLMKISPIACLHLIFQQDF